jgi:hypothetical protein
MQEITLKNSLRKQIRTNENKPQGRGLNGNLTSLLIGGCVFCVSAGLLLLSALPGAGEPDEPLQRVGLALVFIPVLVLGFALKPYGKDD